MDLFTQNLLPALVRMWWKCVNLSQACFWMTIFATEQSVGVCLAAGKYMNTFTQYILVQRILNTKTTVKNLILGLKHLKSVH